MDSFTPMLLLAQQADGPNPLMNFMFFIAILIFAFYFIIVRPQRREASKREETLSTVGKGTKVITIGGIHGSVVSSNKGSDTIEIEIAKGVRITLNRAAISVVTPDKKKGEEKGAKDDKAEKTDGAEVPASAPEEEAKENKGPGKKGRK